MRSIFFLFFLVFFFVPCFVYGKAKEQVEFKTEELERETVLPIFYSKEVVKNRIIKKRKRLEFHFGGGWNNSEAFYKPISLNGSFTFHLNEEHGINLFGAYIFQGLSGTGKDIQFGRKANEAFDFARVPYPKGIGWLHYQFTTHYGKISLTKKMIMNLSIHTLVGAGGVLLSDNKAVPGADVGLGQIFYLSRRFSFRFDLLFFVYRGPDLTSEPSGETEADSQLRFIPHDRFKQVFSYNTYLSLGLGFLF